MMCDEGLEVREVCDGDSEEGLREGAAAI